MLYTTIAILLGFLLDLCFGDPCWMPHPIRLIGALIAKSEAFLRRCFPQTPSGERAAGVCMTLFVSFLSAVVPALLLWGAWALSPFLFLALQALMCYQILAVKSLKTESMKVYDKLRQQDLSGARQAVSMIVGRDTQNLTAEQVTKAAVETVAENTSDGVVAPLLFLMLGGAPLGFFYKAVNTMDSMVGYKNDRYLHFGRFAAKLDDVLNFIPARLSALLMIAASKLADLDAKNAYYIYRRDRRNHASPNSAHTEAVCAGALNIQLAGDAYYFGKLYKKKTIGDANRPVHMDDIPAANRLLYVTAALTLCTMLLLRLSAQFFLGGF